MSRTQVIRCADCKKKTRVITGDQNDGRRGISLLAMCTNSECLASFEYRVTFLRHLSPSLLVVAPEHHAELKKLPPGSKALRQFTRAVYPHEQ